MARRVRFIHAADIHLGSILNICGDIPENKEGIFRKAGLNGFARICSAAVDYEVDFILLSGDVYDQKSRSVAANHFFNQQCRCLMEKGIKVYMIGGNHDPVMEQDGPLELPENVTLFSSEQVEMREVKDSEGRVMARILGQSYRGTSESRKMYSSFTTPDRGVWNIGLLHTQLSSSNNNYVPCTIDDLHSREDIHYWALGHLHQARIFRKDGQLIAFPGIPQGRDVGEKGVGGCLLVDLMPGQSPQVNFIPVSSVIWRKIQISIADDQKESPKNLNELEKLIKKKAEDLLEQTALMFEQSSLILDQKSSMPEQGILETEDISFLKGDWTNYFKGYVIRWILTGRGEINSLFEQQGDEVCQLLTERLQQSLGNLSPFIWTESVVDRTRKSLPKIEELLNRDNIYVELRNIVQLVLSDVQMKEELLEQLGWIWQDEIDHEKRNEFRFQLDDETLEQVVDKARDLIIEGLLERNGFS